MRLAYATVYNATATKLMITHTLQTVADGIEAARKLCGGHGYSHAAGLADASANYLALPTLEGTQQVLEPQTTRYLLRCLAAARKSGGTAPLPPGVQYLLEYSSVNSTNSSSNGASPIVASHPAETDLLDPEVQLALFRRRALLCVLSAEAAVKSSASSSSGSAGGTGSTAAAAAEALVQGGVEVGRAARAHCQLHMLERFSSAVTALEASAKQQQQVMCTLFSLE
jgi:acyl-CoA oxidase